LKKFFHSKKIVYTSTHQPAELVKTFNHAGKKYVRVAFTNRAKYKGLTPVTDVRFSDVTGIRKLPSRFKKFCYSLVGLQARGTFYKINKAAK
jgi:translation initiation factor 1 (eIF-1/SUI1)